MTTIAIKATTKDNNEAKEKTKSRRNRLTEKEAALLKQVVLEKYKKRAALLRALHQYNDWQEQQQTAPLSRPLNSDDEDDDEWSITTRDEDDDLEEKWHVQTEQKVICIYCERTNGRTIDDTDRVATKNPWPLESKSNITDSDSEIDLLSCSSESSVEEEDISSDSDRASDTDTENDDDASLSFESRASSAKSSVVENEMKVNCENVNQPRETTTTTTTLSTNNNERTCNNQPEEKNIAITNPESCWKTKTSAFPTEKCVPNKASTIGDFNKSTRNVSIAATEKNHQSEKLSTSTLKKTQSARDRIAFWNNLANKNGDGNDLQKVINKSSFKKTSTNKLDKASSGLREREAHWFEKEARILHRDSKLNTLISY